MGTRSKPFRFAFGTMICTLATFASATPAEARINQRQNHQQHRIARGINSGSLTPREAAGLAQQQVHIARYEARSRADGNGLSRIERARLEQKQDRASRNIRHQKHDAQGR
jgi:hypothetical protein